MDFFFLIIVWLVVNLILGCVVFFCDVGVGCCCWLVICGRLINSLRWLNFGIWCCCCGFGFYWCVWLVWKCWGNWSCIWLLVKLGNFSFYGFVVWYLLDGVWWWGRRGWWCCWGWNCWLVGCGCWCCLYWCWCWRLFGCFWLYVFFLFGYRICSWWYCCGSGCIGWWFVGNWVDSCCYYLGIGWNGYVLAVCLYCVIWLGFWYWVGRGRY